jgi:spore coat protein U-like protein
MQSALKRLEAKPLPSFVMSLLALAMLFLATPTTSHASGPIASAGTCIVAAIPVVFGLYDSLRHSDFVTVGMLHYRCSGSPSRLSIGLTAGGSGSFKYRRMGRGKEKINYNLYLDAANTEVWGDGTGGSQMYNVSFPPGDTEVTIPIYGRLFGNQNVSAGGYQDDVSVVATYREPSRRIAEGPRRRFKCRRGD